VETGVRRIVCSVFESKVIRFRRMSAKKFTQPLRPLYNFVKRFPPFLPEGGMRALQRPLRGFAANRIRKAGPVRAVVEV
jgi:hypothetical protein